MAKSNYTKRIIDDYCVIDTETTGLSAYNDQIIEIGILKVRNGRIVDRYSQLIQPGVRISRFITQLTGITNRMVMGMPSIDEVEDEVMAFIGDDIILGHNTNFDMRFLNAHFSHPLENKYMDTVQFARKLYPELRSHSLSTLTQYLNLSNNEHRALADCISTQELYEHMKETMIDRGLTMRDLWRSYRD